jgi:hypothetical protein
MANSQQDRAMHYNWGFRDGAHDATRGRFARWFKVYAMNQIANHFDGDYAYGYFEGRQGYRFDCKRAAIADQAAKYRS